MTPTEWIEAERVRFEAAWNKAHPVLGISLAGSYAFEFWLAAKRDVVVTEEMVERGAWGPINQDLERAGVEPFSEGFKPSTLELATARLVLTAALQPGGG